MSSWLTGHRTRIAGLCHMFVCAWCARLIFSGLHRAHKVSQIGLCRIYQSLNCFHGRKGITACLWPCHAWGQFGVWRSGKFLLVFAPDCITYPHSEIWVLLKPQLNDFYVGLNQYRTQSDFKKYSDITWQLGMVPHSNHDLLIIRVGWF